MYAGAGGVSIQLLEGSVTEDDYSISHYYAEGRDDSFSRIGDICCSLVCWKLFYDECNPCMGWDIGVHGGDYVTCEDSSITWELHGC